MRKTERHKTLKVIVRDYRVYILEHIPWLLLATQSTNTQVNGALVTRVAIVRCFPSRRYEEVTSLA